MKRPPVVALVDDDKIFQLTASKTIRALDLTDQILQFQNGEDALQFLSDNSKNTDSLPLVDGWMFLQDFAEIKQNLQKQISIYMVSSSIDPRDVNRARTIQDVTDYVVKPVTKEKFIELLQFRAA
jgi:CheY-like chemotaxis protein